MGDALVGVEDNRDMSIYSFKFGKDNPRPDSSNASLLVRFQDSACFKNFQENFQILKDIEDNIGFGVSYPDIVDYPDKRTVVWVIGDHKWQSTAVMFSLYTYLLKCLTYPIKNKKNWMDEILKAGTVESEYMDKAYLQFLFKNADDIISKYKNFSGRPNQKETDIYSIHYGIGFVDSKPYIYKGNKSDSHVMSGYKAPK
jgi:hypothetical protein